MSKLVETTALALAIILLAAALRFTRLGHYPFSSDELATIAEAQSLFERHEGPITSQYDRLPRLIPLAHLTHALDYRLFGCDEFGSRVLMAILGTSGVLIAMVGLVPIFGLWTATTTALLIAVWPEHLYHSQENRFYITAWFFSALCMVLGSQAVKRRSALRMLCACLLVIAAVLTHTVLVLLFPGLFFGSCAAAWCERRPLPWRLLVVLVVSGLVTLGLLTVFLLPLASGWNATDSTWGYSPFRSMLGSANMIGWPVLLLAGLGALQMFRNNAPQGGYWLAWATTFAVASAILPLFVVYHPNYVFPLSTSLVILAGYAVADLTNALRPRGNLLAYSLSACLIALQFPSLVSHYMDGSRPDYRTAAHYISDHWEPGDRLAAVSPGLIRHYTHLDGPVIGLSGNDMIMTLCRTASRPGRLWIVIPSGRSGKSEDVRRWLGAHCSQELVVRKPRVDYYDNIVEVFLYNASLAHTQLTGSVPKER